MRCVGEASRRTLGFFEKNRGALATTEMEKAVVEHISGERVPFQTC